MYRTLIALVAATLLTSAAFAVDNTSRTITVRAGQGDATTVVVPSSAAPRPQPYQLTGQSREEAKTLTLRAGQSGFVQVPTR